MADETTGAAGDPGAPAQSEPWRRALVVNGIRRMMAGGRQSPTFEMLREHAGLGREDLVEELAALKAEEAIHEEQGRFTVDGDEPVHQVEEIPDLIRPEPDFRPEADPTDEPPPDRTAAVVAEAHTDAAAHAQEGGRYAPPGISGDVGDVRLTVGMAQSLSEEALGGLVRAGIDEAQKANQPFVLRVG